jgi:hypothetical protein
LDRIAIGYEDDKPWAPDRQARERWVGVAIGAWCTANAQEKSDAQIKEMVRAWIEAGILKVTEFQKANRTYAKGVVVVEERRPEREWSPE